MHALRKLARAIHRRSVWQVLIVYVAASWASVTVTGWLTEIAGLPSWTPTLAVLLLLAMLPLVVATTVVQGGLPGLRIEDAADPNDLPGLTPEQVHVIPEAHPLYGSDLLTWRNMVLGGVSAAALLVTSVVAYMTMWALGIGPVGSLMAQGVIPAQGVVSLQPFRNQTEDPSIAALVTDAFDLELSRAWTVEAALEGDASGVALVVSGEIRERPVGYYILTSELASPSGSILARFEEESHDVGDLLETLERLTERVRERMGESLRAIREGDRLAEITTDSDEALRLYRRAGRAWGDGDLGGAMDLLGACVTVDPSFALAWRRLGVLAEGAGDVGVARGAYQRVIDLWEPSGRAERTVQHVRERIALLESL